MRGRHLPSLLRDSFKEWPEFRAKVCEHFGVSDWKVSCWMAGTQKPSPDQRARIADYIELLLARKARGD